MESVLKIVAALITADGKLSDPEARWFNWLVDRHIRNPDQKKAILDCLENSPDIETLVDDVSLEDQERLLSWARIAIKIDGVSLIEKKTYKKLKELIERSNKTNHPNAFASAILSAEKDRALWVDLKEAGAYFRQSRYIPRPDRPPVIIFHWNPFIWWPVIIFASVYAIVRALTAAFGK